MKTASLFLLLPIATHGLRPQNSLTRTARALDSSTRWRLKLDPQNVGLADRWALTPLAALAAADGLPLFDAPVPSTLNDVVGADPLAAAANWTDGYFFPAWYEASIFLGPATGTESRSSSEIDLTDTGALSPHCRRAQI